MDELYDLPFARAPHPDYDAPIPAFETVKHSIVTMRGCFGGCSFCSITEHEGRVIQSRSADSVLREVRALSRMADFRGVISDIGGPTANMYQMKCKSERIENACRRLSCVHPKICENLVTDHQPLIDLLARVREEKTRQARLHRLRHPLRPRQRKPGVHPRHGRTPHRWSAQRRPRAQRHRRARQDEEAADRALRALRAGVLSGQRGRGQAAIPDPLPDHGPPRFGRGGHHLASRSTSRKTG